MFMEYIVTSNENNNLVIGAKGIEDVLQCIQMILGIIEGTVFLDRKFGISSEIVDNPLNRMDKLHEEIYRKIEEYEPRAEVTSIKIKTDNLEGKSNIVVGVRVDEEYL